MLRALAQRWQLKAAGSADWHAEAVHAIAEAPPGRGEFTFGSATTAIPGDSAAQSGYANAMASFLLDVPVAIERGLVAVSDVGAPLDERHRGGRHKSVFTYIHDKWQVRPNITLDLGLRHEYYTPLVGLDEKGSLSNYDPATNTLRVAGYSGVPDNVGVKKQADDLYAVESII